MNRLLFTVAVLAAPLWGQSIGNSFSFGGSGSVYSSLGATIFLRDTAQSIAVDTSGNVIVAGTAFSPDFPQVHALTQVAFPCEQGCGIFRAPFVAKLDATGSSLVYATLLGAPSPTLSQDVSLLPTAVAVDAAGNAYVTGTTNLPNFPTAKGVALTPLGGSDAFLIKLDPTGNVIYSTLFGSSGEDAGSALALGPNSVVYIVRSTVLQSPGVATSDQEQFLTTLDASTGRVLTAIDLGQGRNPQLTPGLPSQVNVALTTGCLGCSPQVIVQRVDTSASKVLNTPYSGPMGETLIGMATGADESLYLAVNTSEQPTIKHFDPAGTPQLTTTIAQLKQGSPKAFALDQSGKFYLGGTAFPGLPQLHSSQPSPIYSSCPYYSPSGGFRGYTVCANSGFITSWNATTAGLNWSTYIGGNSSTVFAITTDSQGNVYIAGQGLALSGPNAGKSVSIVKFTQQNPAITINPDALTDSASYYPGLPNPRGLATVFLSGVSGIEGTLTAQTVPLPMQLAGVSVRVDGVLAPLLAISNNGQGQQINFQVPSTQNLDSGTIVQISQGNNSTFFGAPRTPPGIFVLPDGTPAIQHAADYSLVTAAKPVVPGETIIIYVTGLADPHTLPADGTPFTEVIPVSEVSVSVGGLAQQILYAGGAPGLIGVYQINCKISAPLASGPQTLSVGSRNPFSTGFQTLSKPVTLVVQ